MTRTIQIIVSHLSNIPISRSYRRNINETKNSSTRKKKKKKKKDCIAERIECNGCSNKGSCSVCADLALIKREKGNSKKSRIDGFTTLTTHIRFPSARTQSRCLVSGLVFDNSIKHFFRVACRVPASSQTRSRLV